MKRAFMVMPFSDDIVRQAYEHCVKPIFESRDLEIRKADEIFTTNPIYDDIVQEIQNAQVIVVDISGKNPNVFYELGIAHHLKQSQTIILTHDEYKEMPFDIAHFRIIHYDNTIEGSSYLKTQINQTLDYILSDYGIIYKDEYKIVMNTMTHSNGETKFMALIGLNNLGGILSTKQRLEVEGHSNDNDLQSIGDTVKSTFNVFVGIGYVKMEGDSVYITDKGKGFVEQLVLNGYACDRLNENIFTKDYVSPFKEN